MRTAAWAPLTADLPALVTCPVIVTMPFGVATCGLSVSMVITTGYSAVMVESAAGRTLPPAGSAPAGVAVKRVRAAAQAAARRAPARRVRRAG
ncbi:hypothetical protein GCM10010519_44610 [Streptomyces lactacystinicus]